MDIAYIPSPSTGVLHLGPLPLRGYAFCIIIGVFVAVWYGGKRWVARGGKAGTVADIAVWAVPFGLVGGRLYHVITDYQLYFSDGKDWVNAFKVWEGGLGIWGAIAFGAVGAWIGCRRRGIPLPAWADALAPAVAIAQAIGRWGNWFNQELYGKHTDLPWKLKITGSSDRVAGYYQPTFLYESLWCLLVAALVVWADRRFKLGHGRVFALYVAAYCVGRAWIEYMRVDEAHHILGVRLNVWTAAVVFVLAVVYFVLSSRVRPGREEIVEPELTERPGDPAEAKTPEDGKPAKDLTPGKDLKHDKDPDKDLKQKKVPGTDLKPGTDPESARDESPVKDLAPVARAKDAKGPSGAADAPGAGEAGDKEPVAKAAPVTGDTPGTAAAQAEKS